MSKYQITVQVLLSAAAILLLCISCGIPQFSPPPGEPELQVVGGEVYVGMKPSDREYTSGILVMYRISNLSTAEYQTMVDALSGMPGNSSYSSLVNQGFVSVASVLFKNGRIPTFDFAAYDSLFQSSDLREGLPSITSEAKILVTFGQAPENGSELQIREDGVEIDTIALQRNSGNSGNTDFFPDGGAAGFNLSDDSDLQHLVQAGVTEITADTDLLIELALFGYRSEFGEGPLYSIPALLQGSERIQLPF